MIESFKTGTSKVALGITAVRGIVSFSRRRNKNHITFALNSFIANLVCLGLNMAGYRIIHGEGELSSYSYP